MHDHSRSPKADRSCIARHTYTYTYSYTRTRANVQHFTRHPRHPPLPLPPPHPPPPQPPPPPRVLPCMHLSNLSCASLYVGARFGTCFACPP
eukprot:4229170-Prymnesium_polylepis.1